MSSSEDSYDYEQYCLEAYEELEGPPLIKKRARIIAAVAQNQVGVLSDLLDSPKWYKIRDKYGYNLLQIAILRDNEEVFDYLLTLPDFPLEYVNKNGETALTIALTGFVSNDIWMSEHFAYELIKKGANIDQNYYEGNTSLLCAIDRSYVNVTKLLINLGVDINVSNDNNDTPLTLALTMSDIQNTSEIVSMLLVSGAEATVSDFECAVLRDLPLFVQENLFLYVFHESLDIRLDVLLRLAENKSTLLHEIIECPLTIKISDSDLYPYYRVLCSINIDYLKVIVDKFGIYIQRVLARSGGSSYFMHRHNKSVFIENLQVMLESDLKDAVVDFITRLDSSEMFADLVDDLDYSEPTVTELYLYLLSYGLNLRETDLQLVYNCFNYCDLFKIMLHMDIEMSVNETIRSIFPIFVYDIHMDMEKLFKYPFNFSTQSWNTMVDYFVYPKLTRMYCRLADEGILAKRDKVYEIPSLVELGRNAFRKFLVKKFKINTSRQFYTLVKCLPINNVYKKIITYETKLYYVGENWPPLIPPIR